MSGWEGFLHGLDVALQPGVLIYCAFGVILGTFVGVLPGIGAMATILLCGVVGVLWQLITPFIA